MKHFLPITAILGLTLACAPPNKLASIEKTQDSIQKEKRIDIEKQIAPGTCSLYLNNCEIVSENKTQWIKGKISSIKAYGAGFLSTFEKGQILEIKITEQQASNLKTEEDISCVISSIEGLNNNPNYKLIDYKLQDKE